MLKRNGTPSIKAKWIVFASAMTILSACASRPKPGTLEEAQKEITILEKENADLLSKLYECLESGESLRRNCGDI